MKINQAGLDLIKSFEKCRLTAYKDAVGILTIGWGQTGPWVTEGLTIDQETADRWLYESLDKLEDGLSRRLAGVPITENQFSALVSLGYNIGLGALLASTALRKLRAGDTKGAADAILMWNKSNGKVLKGLTVRRVAEWSLFLR